MYICIYKGLNSPSTTAQLKLLDCASEFRKKYIEIARNKGLNDYNAMINNAIIVKKCEEWMFKLDKESGVEVTAERTFPGLIWKK